MPEVSFAKPGMQSNPDVVAAIPSVSWPFHRTIEKNDDVLLDAIDHNSNGEYEMTSFPRDNKSHIPSFVLSSQLSEAQRSNERERERESK